MIIDLNFPIPPLMHRTLRFINSFANCIPKWFRRRRSCHNEVTIRENGQTRFLRGIMNVFV